SAYRDPANDTRQEDAVHAPYADATSLADRVQEFEAGAVPAMEELGTLWRAALLGGLVLLGIGLALLLPEARFSPPTGAPAGGPAPDEGPTFPAPRPAEQRLGRGVGWWEVAWLLACMALSSAWCVTASRELSAFWDEPFYMLLGLTRWQT